MSKNTFEIAATSLGYSLEKDSDGSYVDSYLNAAYLINSKINTRTQNQCELFYKMLHEVANQYSGDGLTEWSIGANHVFMLFGKWVAKNVPPKAGE